MPFNPLARGKLINCSHDQHDDDNDDDVLLFIGLKARLIRFIGFCLSPKVWILFWLHNHMIFEFSE